MSKRIEKGDLIYGDYAVTEVLRENPVYRWVRALERARGRSVVLQLLDSDMPVGQIPALLEYFDAVQGIQRKGLITPEQTLSDRDFPLILLYPALLSEPMDAAMALSPERAVEFWKQACETVFILHNRSLCYGSFTPNSFVMSEDRVCLTDFGFAPLLATGDARALDICRTDLAPETLSRHEITPASDLYSLTRHIADWKPGLRRTDWYRRGTHVEPGQRFHHARELYDGLEAALAQILPMPTPLPAAPILPDTDSHLVPIIAPAEFNVMGYVNPAEAGEIAGIGHYPAGKTVQIEARAFRGWRFVEWSGDLNGTQNTQPLTVECGKTVVAHFERAARRPPDPGAGWWTQTAE